MKPTLPPFERGVHYRELSPAEGHRRWRWMLLRPLVTPLLYPAPNMAFVDADGIERMRYEDGCRVIHEDYAWNGCSPKWYALGRWWGTPDTPNNLAESCNHDGDYQFSGVPGYPFSRNQVDWMFRAGLEARGFFATATWHRAVRAFGCHAWGINRGEAAQLILNPAMAS